MFHFIFPSSQACLCETNFFVCFKTWFKLYSIEQPEDCYLLMLLLIIMQNRTMQIIPGAHLQHELHYGSSCVLDSLTPRRQATCNPHRPRRPASLLSFSEILSLQNLRIRLSRHLLTRTQKILVHLIVIHSILLELRRQ